MFDFLEPLFVSLFNRFQKRSKEPSDPTKLIPIGYRVVEGRVTKQPVGLSLAARSRHTVITGKSGMGKTSHLKNELTSAIRDDRGTFTVDLHGDLTPHVLGTVAEEEKRRQQDLSDRLIVISPSDPDMSVGLNPLEGIGGDFARSTEIAEVLRQHARTDYLGPRTEELLRNSVVVLTANALTLADFVPLLADIGFRTKCVEKTPNAEVRAFFQSRYDKSSDAMQAAAREPILNKISAFTADPRFRHIVGQSHSTFSMREAMDRRCWVVAYLPKGELGAGQALTFASLLLTAVKNALFARKHKALYTWVLDEAQNYIAQSSDIETVLSEARKFGVGLVLANQFLDQYPPSMRTAILSVANFISFQLSSADAATMAQMLDGGKSLAEHIKNLPPRHFILKSGSEPWVEGKVPKVETPKADYTDLLKRSRAKYARPRADIEREIAERHSSMRANANEVLHDWE